MKIERIAAAILAALLLGAIHANHMGMMPSKWYIIVAALIVVFYLLGYFDGERS